MQNTGEPRAQTSLDVIDTMLGNTMAATVADLRERRAVARINAQQSYVALFGADTLAPSGFSAIERFAVALFVSALHRQDAARDFYGAALQRCIAASTASGHGLRDVDPTSLLDIVMLLGRAATSHGPYGNYPAGPLSAEDRPGPLWAVDGTGRAVLGARLAAAFDHVHLLVYHPRDASAAALQTLIDNGWSSDDVIVLSQMVAFLTFQIRIVHGLAVVAGMRSVSATVEAAP